MIGFLKNEPGTIPHILPILFFATGKFISKWGNLPLYQASNKSAN
jgi:hypothetical protein